MQGNQQPHPKPTYRHPMDQRSFHRGPGAGDPKSHRGLLQWHLHRGGGHPRGGDLRLHVTDPQIHISAQFVASAPIRVVSPAKAMKLLRGSLPSAFGIVKFACLDTAGLGKAEWTGLQMPTKTGGRGWFWGKQVIVFGAQMGVFICMCVPCGHEAFSHVCTSQPIDHSRNPKKRPTLSQAPVQTIWSLEVCKRFIYCQHNLSSHA